jgi:hypothetical protein
MKISLVNFSDVHFKNRQDAVMQKKEKLIRAIKSRTSDSDKIVFIMNGDSAFSGKKDEYAIAFDFFGDVISSFEETDFMCVAGNHDCDFSEMDEEIRQYVINNIKGKSGSMKPDIDLEKVILQKEFDSYFQAFKGFWTASEIIVEGALFKSIDFKVNEGVKIRFNLINTAWDSSLHEQPGTMYMPTSDLENISYEKEAILNVSVMHHPTHWLEPNNKREFERIINNISDVVLSGHEHADSVVSQITKLGETVMIEGSVLQENSVSDSSGFNVLDINIDESDEVRLYVHQFEWNLLESMYKVTNEQEIKLNTYESLSFYDNYNIFCVVINKSSKWRR